MSDLKALRRRSRSFYVITQSTLWGTTYLVPRQHQHHRYKHLCSLYLCVNQHTWDDSLLLTFNSRILPYDDTRECNMRLSPEIRAIKYSNKTSVRVTWITYAPQVNSLSSFTSAKAKMLPQSINNSRPPNRTHERPF